MPAKQSDYASKPQSHDYFTLIRRLIRSQDWAQHWPEERVADAVQDVALIMHQLGWTALLSEPPNKLFDTPVHDAMKFALFGAIERVRDRSRRRRRIEVKPSSPDYRPDPAELGKPRRRQRRDLPPDEPLGSHVVVDLTATATKLTIGHDVREVLQRLSSTDRQIVCRIVCDGRTRAEVAAELRMSVSSVSTRYHAAIRKLQFYLRSYAVND